ncbi:putative late blight resistance protein homolog R1B-16 [Nicotiana sylvestris]
MVTTRIEQVAKHLQHRSDPYSLRFLTLEESWELLIKKVFQGESCPPNLLEASLQVAEHCKGLPLVIVLIAGIIVKMERQESLWLEVANDLSSHALGEQSMKVIQSSYEHLEDHLKPCLLYMGLFPEDYKIPVSALLNLWIAEEFVLNVDTENYMEEAARVCLNDLLNRSLVMVSKRRRNGDIKYCILHDVVREFCSAKLREEKFVQLIVPYNPYKHLYTKESRLCTYIHDDLVEQLDHCEYQVDKITIHESEESTKCFGQCSKPSLEFIAHPEFETWKNRSNPLRLLVELKLVRVLHLMDVETSSSWVPTVKLLTHLRYLALYVKDQFEFKWVSHLHDLHTLKVASRKTLFPRSSGLWKMNNLRHVNMRKVFLLLENEEEESSETLLENLKTFCNLRVYDDRNPRSWWRFPNLEELGLSLESLPCRSLFPISEVHTRLQSLDLECPCKTYRYPHSVGWESYFVFPSNLKNLRIRHFSITKELTSNIARLQKLEKLKIIWGLLLGKECWDVREMEFQALKYLTLEWMDLREWKASEESFPVLEKLLIKGCYSLDAIPPSFADIPTLQLIELYGCPDSVEDSAMNIKREIEETTGRDTLQLMMYY